MRRFGLPVAFAPSSMCFAAAPRLGFLTLHSRAQLAAENLFLRKQLELYREPDVRPRRADDATRITLVALSRFVDWRQLLVIVKPDTLIRWHRKAFRLFWQWRSKEPGRPRIPANLRRLIAEMATANRTWGEERIAAELLVKLGIRVSPRTVRRYMPPRGTPRSRTGSRAWSTFVRNHARAVSGVRFLRYGRRDVSRGVRVRGPRSRNPTHPALEHDGTSNRRMDGAAVPHDHFG